MQTLEAVAEEPRVVGQEQVVVLLRMQVLVVLEHLVMVVVTLVVLVELEQLAEEAVAEVALEETRSLAVLAQVLLVQVVQEELFFTASHNKQKGQNERNNIYQCAWV
jgi:hypothetical protein